MAPGYVIALALEAAGVAGLVLGLVTMRAERRARAAELRGLLLTGNANAAGCSARGIPGKSVPRRVVVPVLPADTAQDAFAARSALHRALSPLSAPERAAA